MSKNLQQIRCQAHHKLDRDGYFGCQTCRGYGVVLQQRRCGTCGHVMWIRPDTGYTTYVGKKWTSVDGVGITDQGFEPSTCDRCPK